MEKRVKNPILPGFYPDPSICRVGSDYYLVTSTFAYFPGVPIFHSKDLVNWKQIGNILDRREQIELSGVRLSQGIYAPTIRYHDGTFYMITTNVSGGGNFIVTAKDPAGPWSDPYFIEGAQGIDPSLFFDDDGRCYYIGTKKRREGGKYYGDNEIWLQELDIKNMKLIGESYAIWHGALKDVEWPEGPHLYKKDGRYYLLIAEGGTGHAHAVTVASSDRITGPYVGYNCNPILTHRHLGLDYPIVNVGHGDLVETQNGEWYMVLLGSRPYGGYYRNLGRETFLVPVEWENGWPLVNRGIGLVESTVKVPNLPLTPVEPLPEKEDFDDEKLPYRFMYLRNPNSANYSLTERKGYLRMKLAPEKLTELVSPSYVCIRQTGMSFIFEAKMEFEPENNSEEAGIVIFQNDKFNYRLVKKLREGVKTLCLIRCKEGKEEVLAEANVQSSRNEGYIILRIEARLQDLTFSFSFDNEEYHVLMDGVDARILSTDVAGGFVGNTLGIYCSSNKSESNNYADFDWIYYKNID
ncbi:alpha-N-arabinofuranosidase [Herbinix hemicellulosilytica]|uniref:Xylosidase/arabinosidase n=1 Tax=Herbinix hemicellulosilytica TaxID=1564487 RepID=A0A0H5SY45_HERHM|nr:glycoside hydrolase family 43 protein [Herbinix hemicellulosilytica]RBP56760.1 alpha-N-arabinofuranosidase [Herbinix hemicellulosilytica]CRZ35303.1 Xylosidase/arabinosidase [Herbinix hemicellulosilytica]